jgi:hypothetical protein
MRQNNMAKERERRLKLEKEAALVDHRSELSKLLEVQRPPLIKEFLDHEIGVGIGTGVESNF